METPNIYDLGFKDGYRKAFMSVVKMIEQNDISLYELYVVESYESCVFEEVAKLITDLKTNKK